MPTTVTLATVAVFAVGYAAGHLDHATGRWLLRAAKRRKQQPTAA